MTEVLDDLPDPLDAVVADFLARRRAGEVPSAEEYARRYPELAGRIRALFPTLLLLEGGPTPTAPSTGSHEDGGDVAAALGPFRILREVSRGGMGVVYEAVQEPLGRRVALKVLPPEYARRPGFRERFQREAAAAARLHHTNIVPVFASGECEGTLYFAMQFIDGRTATEWRAPPAGRAREVARLGLQAAEALAYAHEHGVLHRDVKPANLLLDGQGTLWVADFGLAKAQGADDLTGSGELLGTLRYLAPERFAGRCDARSDVYALGVSLYEMLADRPAFDERDRLNLVRQIGGGVGPLRRAAPWVPADLETVIHKALAVEPAGRYVTARELAEDLRRFLADEPVRARRLGPVGRLRRWARRRPAVAVLLLLVALVSAAGMGGILWAYGQARQAESTSREEAENARQEKRRADGKAAEALQKEKEALWQAHLAQLGRIDALLLAGDHTGALLVLDRLRPEYRGWEYGYLRRRAEGTPLTLRGHAGAVRCVCFSPDGTRIASAAADEAVKVWDAATGAELATLRGHAGQVICVCFSPDGTRLASAAADQTVKVWDAATGAEVTTLRGHTNVVSSVRYSPDGTRLASASVDKTVKVWDSRSGAALATLRGHTAGVAAVAFSPDGTRLASASVDKTVKVWETRGGTELRTLRAHASSVGAVVYSPDGSRLASASHDQTVKVWDAQSGTEVATLGSHTSAVYSVCYSPDGTRLASASADKTIKVWDARSGAELATLRGHTHFVTSVVYSPEGARLASASFDNSMKVWDAPGGSETAGPRGHTETLSAVCFSPDGTRIATASEDRTVKVWDTHGGAAIATLQGHTDLVLAVAFSPDGTRLASASVDKTVKVWDSRSGLALATLRGHTAGVHAVAFSPDGTRLASAGGDSTAGEIKVWDVRSGAESATLRGHTQLVNSVAYSPDGTRLASASWDNTVKVWDAKGGAEVATLRGHLYAVWSVCYSPDGTRLASAAEDRTVKVWDTQTATEVATLLGHTLGVYSVRYSPDGGRLASAAADNTVKVWDTRAATEVATLRGHKALVRSVCFDTDGARLASASFDNTLKVWDARIATEVATLRGHTFGVCSVVYSPDGTRLASGAQDQTVKLWEAKSGAEVATLRGHAGYVYSVCFSPDGTRLASASVDQTVKVWDAHSGAELATLRGHTGAVNSVNYSLDGAHIVAMDGSGQTVVWDAASGKPLAGMEPPQRFPADNASPDGRFVAVPDGADVRIFLRRTAAGGYDPWGEDAQRRRVQAPLWHAEQAEAAQKRGDRFAAVFHRHWLSEGDSLRLLAWARLADGDNDGAWQALRQLREEQRGAAVAAQVSGVLASALAVRPVPATPAGPLAAAELARREQWRRAAELVRAAVLWPDSHIDVAELVALARSCVEADAQSWQYRELLGAALYRDGQAAEALRELQEAVRRHGQGGSLWARLFLALAHQRLGQAGQAREWRAQAGRADTWEEAVVRRQLLGELGPAPQPAKP
jgi:WD40 repeat protein